MKNLISALSTFVLAVFIPAIFIAYLVKNDPTNIPTLKKGEVDKQLNINYETSFKPGLVFTIKG